MKNSFKPTMFVMLMSLTMVSTSAFSTTPENKAVSANSTSAEAQILSNRLNEIKAMDVSSMTRKQKRELKHEVKAINHKMSVNGGGVYISVGAAILIILLLIILL